MNVFNIVLDLVYKLSDLYNVLIDFLFKPVNIGFNGINILGVTLFNFSITLDMWAVVGGTGLLVFLTLSLAKKFIPFL